MHITKAQLNNFKKAWLKYSGDDISDEKATELLTRAVGLLQPIYKSN